VMDEVVIFLWVFFGFIMCGFVFISLNGIGASEGKHIGYVTAVEFNDNIIWDANLVYFKTDTESTQEDIYCVNDAQTKALLEQYAVSKTRVTVRYQHPFWFWRSICNGGTSVIVGVDG
jgi:hypothetical protein